MTPISTSALKAHTTTAQEPKSSLKRKRNPNELLSDDSQQSTSSKLLKVSFDDDVEIRMVDELGERPVHLIRQEIRHAISQHCTRRRDDGKKSDKDKKEDEVDRSDEEYCKLKQQLASSFSLDQGYSKTLTRKYLLGMISNVTLLTRQCGDLVQAVLEMKWLGQDDAIVATYVKFLGNLVSSQSGNVGSVLMMLVGNFTTPSHSAGPLALHPNIGAAKLRDRVHTTVRYILQLVPSASGTLSSILTSKFPFAADTEKAHVRYVRNLLRVTEYAPELTTEVLDLIMERLVKIDVQVQIDIEDLEEELEEGVIPDERFGQKQIDGEDDFSDVESISSEESLDEEEKRVSAIKASVTKLDTIIDVMFSHHDPTFSKPTTLVSQSMFTHLLTQFRRTILPTNRSRFAQFVLFRFAQRSPELVSRFVDTCIEVLTEKTRASFLRTSAAAYLASFTARGAQVSSSTVIYVFDTLAAYADRLRKEYEPSCREPGAKKGTVYYSTIQALLYIFCFRWRDLLNDPDDYIEEPDDDLFDGGDLTWAPGIKEAFTRNFMSKVCST